MSKGFTKEYLNVFKLNYIPFWRRIKFAWQRATRGYCDFDWWNLDTYYTCLLTESLRDYIKNTHGFSPCIAGDFETYQERISNLADQFEELANWEEDEEFPIEASNEEKGKWIQDRHEELMVKTREAFDELNEVFWSLWD